MNYNVRRGLREIVASSHRLNKADWISILEEFDGRCSYCGSEASAENRGIVADHLIPVTEFGELVAGNTVPACQTCNDSRGNRDWKNFLTARYPDYAVMRIAKIEEHINRFNYRPAILENALTPSEQVEYIEIVREWEKLLGRAKALKTEVENRRAEETLIIDESGPLHMI
ncbi:HNH endonuclease [Pseudomonas sp. Irchel 3E13]|uniref:HNH endonuclease n=1 Tax=Pseudomonas sp. Irchel 3E13 TaxID=2008975 RepID=UPI00135BE883|nr:HNH endonuclease signature motif containing protein [Pseudomonas sp. Irchel 3E13]